MMRERPTSSSPHEAEIIRRVLAGERDEYAALIQAHQQALFRHALGMVGDPDSAADLVQDAFVKAYTSLAQCRDPAMFRSWIFRIMRNRCLDYLKNRRRKDLSLDEGIPLAIASGDPAQELDLAESGRMIERAMGDLPEAQREAFLLKHVDGQSYEEIAGVTGASVSALKMRVKRAREALQMALTRSGLHDDVTDPQSSSSLGQPIAEARQDTLAQKRAG